MKFSKHAQDNMLFFLNDAEHYIKKIGPHQQRRLDLLLGKLYKDIYNSNTFITSLLRRDLLKYLFTIVMTFQIAIFLIARLFLGM